jgi:peptide chain release factor 2
MIKGDNVYSKLKYESGSHRVQRVPATETQGRIHTSTATVLVMPEQEDIDIDIKDQDIRIDVYHSSGAGGQSVNTTDSAVRITHIPTNTVVTCQNERSQIKNKDMAIKILKNKLYKIELDKRQKEVSDIKGIHSKIEFGSQIRSYIMQPYAMVKDHRTDYETGNVEKVMDGYIDEFIEAYLKRG